MKARAAFVVSLPSLIFSLVGCGALSAAEQQLPGDTGHVQRALDTGHDGGSILDAGETELFGEARGYVNQLFETPEACAEAMKFGVNCSQWIRFGPEGGVILLVTDIVNPGTYSLKGNVIELVFPNGSEMGRGPFLLTVHEETGELEWNDFPQWPRWKLEKREQ